MLPGQPCIAVFVGHECRLMADWILMQPLPRGSVPPDGALLLSFFLYSAVLIAACMLVRPTHMRQGSCSTCSGTVHVTATPSFWQQVLLQTWHMRCAVQTHNAFLECRTFQALHRISLTYTISHTFFSDRSRRRCVLSLRALRPPYWRSRRC